MKKSIGAYAGYVAAVAYLAAAGMAVWANIVADPNVEDEGLGAAGPYVTWTVLIMLGTIGAAVVAGALRRRSEKAGVLGIVAVGFTIAAAVASFLAWAWFLLGGLLLIGYVLLSLALRRDGTGIICNERTPWDWAIPVAPVVGIVVGLLLHFVVGVEDVDGGKNWAGASILITAFALYAATLFLAAQYLRLGAPVTEETPALVA